MRARISRRRRRRCRARDHTRSSSPSKGGGSGCKGGVRSAYRNDIHIHTHHIYIYVLCIYAHTRARARARDIHIKAVNVRGWTLTVGDGGGEEDEYYSRKLFAFSDAIYPVRACVCRVLRYAHTHTHTGRTVVVRARAHTQFFSPPF